MRREFSSASPLTQSDLSSPADSPPKKPHSPPSAEDLSRIITNVDELERKYLVKDQDILIFLRDEILKLHKNPDILTSCPVSPYYDEPETWALRDKKMTLRTRFTNPYKRFLQAVGKYTGFEVSVKTDGHVLANTTSRKEYEVESHDPKIVEAKNLDLSLLKHDAAIDLLAEYIDNPEKLRKIFVTVVTRHAYRIPVEVDGHKVMLELAFDSCQYFAAKGSKLKEYYQDKELDHHFELEIEVKPELCDKGTTMGTALRAIKILEDEIINIIGHENRHVIEDNFLSKGVRGYALVKTYMKACGLTLPKGAETVPDIERIRCTQSGRVPVPSQFFHDDVIAKKPANDVEQKPTTENKKKHALVRFLDRRFGGKKGPGFA